ncbi:MAG: type IV pilus modification protein PilV [Burkholderiaceae bacterium]|nr:MAG: type IV pilus modification protein PilV [Burkholderiaceae bacterium]
MTPRLRSTSIKWPKPLAQSGYVLIEVLVSILIFAVGILALVGLQAKSMESSRDAKYRADAAFLADQIIGVMWADKRVNLASYTHNSAGASCAFSGGASGNANVTGWIGSVGSYGSVLDSLPGSTASSLQIQANGATGQVTVTVCWKSPQDSSMHNYVAATQIVGGL